MRIDRSVGPFSPWPSCMDERLALVLENTTCCDDFDGDVDGPGFYSLHKRSGSGRGGYVTSADSDGFRGYDEYDDDVALLNAWREVREHCATYYEDTEVE